MTDIYHGKTTWSLSLFLSLFVHLHLFHCSLCLLHFFVYFLFLCPLTVVTVKLPGRHLTPDLSGCIFLHTLPTACHSHHIFFLLLKLPSSDFLFFTTTTPPPLPHLLSSPHQPFFPVLSSQLSPEPPLNFPPIFMGSSLKILPSFLSFSFCFSDKCISRSHSEDCGR